MVETNIPEESGITPNTHTPNSESPKDKIIFSISPAALILISIILIGLTSILLGTKPTPKTTPPTNPEIGQEVNPIHKSPAWVLKKTTSNGENIVFSIPDGVDAIASWKNTIYYAKQEYQNNIQILAFELGTDKSSVYYDQKKVGHFSDSGKGRYINDLQVIGDELYFSIGGYMVDGATFYSTLPSGKFVKLMDNTNSRIVFWKNRYWILGGEGDACWGVMNYALFDIDTKKVTPVASSNIGCAEGDEFIDIDTKDRMIMSYHTPGTGDGEEFSNGIYLSVSAIPLASPKEKQTLISEKNMPKAISAVYYLADSNQLLLVGKEKYLYDIKSNKITITQKTPPSETKSDPLAPQNLEEKIKSIKLPAEYKFVKE